MIKERGENKGFGKEKNPPQQQMLYGKDESGNGNYWTWNDPWTKSLDRNSGVHSVLEPYAWQFGDGTTLFGLEVRTPTIEEAQNMRETVRSGKVHSVKVDTPALDQKPWICVKTAGSDEQIPSKKLATCSSDKDPHSFAGSMKLQTPNRCEVLGADVIVDQ